MIVLARRQLGSDGGEYFSSLLEWTQADVSKCETGVRRLDVIELRIWLKALGYELADFVQALDNSVPLLPDQARNSPAAAQ